MTLEEFGQVIPEHIFNATVCSKQSKRDIIERDFYTLYLYNDKAFALCKNDDGKNIHIKITKEGLTKLLFHKIDIYMELIEDMKGKDLNEFFTGQALMEVLEESSILGHWFLETNAHIKEGGKNGKE